VVVEYGCNRRSRRHGIQNSSNTHTRVPLISSNIKLRIKKLGIVCIVYRILVGLFGTGMSFENIKLV
jgi:hypothetical protein